MRKTPSTLVLLFLVGFLAACAAETLPTLSTLSSLRTEMNALATQKQALVDRNATAPRNGAGAAAAATSLVQIDSDLLAVSEEAAALARADSTSERVALSAWRIAVHAAWIAFPVGIDAPDSQALTRALALAEEGREACVAAEAGEGFANPRDCALIRFTPVQIAFQTSWARYEGLKARATTGAQPADYFTDLAQLYRQYRLAVWDRAWEERAALAVSVPTLDQSLVQYMEEETFLFLCAALVPFPRPLGADPSEDGEAAKSESIASYKRLRAALAERYGQSEAELTSEKTRACTSELDALGMAQ